MKTIEFTESGRVFGEGARVEGNVIHGVSLLGAKSSNGRVYTRQAMADAAKLYPGTQIFANHPSHRDLTGTGGRRFEDLAGKVIGAWVSGDRVKGDIQLLTGQSVAEKIKTIAGEAPNLAGFSHRASGQASVAEDGTQVVERITEVHALEIVVDPATTRGLFESEDRAMRKTRKQEDTKRDHAGREDDLFGAIEVQGIFNRTHGAGIRTQDNAEKDHCRQVQGLSGARCDLAFAHHDENNSQENKPGPEFDGDLDPVL